MSQTSALECENLTKVFGGLVAVDHVNLNVGPGERRAIIGPNGAGKTTFFSVISGIHKVSSGLIRFYGRDITNQPIQRRTRLGLGRTFQITTLFPTLTVLENLVIAAMGLKMAKFSMLKPLSTYRHFYEKAENLLSTMEMLGKGAEVVRNLSYGEQRQIEVCLALISNPKIILLDEPTAGLSPADSASMATVIRKLDPTITILIIEHDMDVAFQVANKITVLHNGRVFAEGTPAEIRNNEKVQEIYFGSQQD
jgi:branched-chain amino acid transport system ATP-binding protein